MKISEINEGMNFTLFATVAKIEGTRQVETRYGSRTLTEAVLKDDSGSIALNLWGSQSRMLSIGEEVMITNGYAKRYGDRLQISVSGSGSIAKGRWTKS